MARRTLDRGRAYGTVHGVHELGAAFFQDGHYFDAKGLYVCSEAGVSPPKDDGKPQAAPAAPAPTPVPAAPSAPPADDRRAALMQLNIGQLTKMIKEAGGAPVTGQGAKVRSVDWLLANVPG